MTRAKGYVIFLGAKISKSDKPVMQGKRQVKLNKDRYT